MQLIYKDKKVDINSEEDLNFWWSKFQQEMLESDEIPYYIRIQDIEIYENLHETLRENVYNHDIEAELVSIHREQLFLEIEQSLYEYIGRVLSQLEQLANPFYGNVTSKHWDDLTILLEGLEWIIHSWNGLSSIHTDRQQQMVSLQRNFEHVTKLLLQEIEAQNRTGIGDCLLYELQPLLEDMRNLLRRARN